MGTNVIDGFADERARIVAELEGRLASASLQDGSAILEEAVASPELIGFITERAYPELGEPAGGAAE